MSGQEKANRVRKWRIFQRLSTIPVIIEDYALTKSGSLFTYQVENAIRLVQHQLLHLAERR